MADLTPISASLQGHMFMNAMPVKCLYAAILLAAFTACGGGKNQFRLHLEQKAPSAQKSGEVLYHPLDVTTLGEILRSRSFYERHLRAQLNQRNYRGTWEDFWQSAKVMPDEKESALVIVFHSGGTEAGSQEIAEAVGAALNEYYLGMASLAEGARGLVRSVERVK